MSRLWPQSTQLEADVVEEGIELAGPLDRRCHNQVTAAARVNSGQTVARLDHALEEDDVARSHDHPTDDHSLPDAGRYRLSAHDGAGPGPKGPTPINRGRTPPLHAKVTAAGERK
jgi:hypothetical protein